ncbi:hypothetical protein CWS35_15890 [Bradyrhizobium sp. SK17]|uniref:LysR substrate-binding domain-containing protein n=1 Tax=Bradyrhizobium sp. SK17 TaxID=2057741 RepID=UPI000C305902|nr:LysR substrate-binding domain-containing protein [Bradyrhizobium sp. SK17]AUC95550.1 hypothetical protein CWS35_15890 [Bradyrhizobium sp. SK17]
MSRLGRWNGTFRYWNTVYERWWITGTVDDLVLLSEIIQAGSLSAASRRTGIPKSTLSRRMDDLEKELGVHLLNRGPRNFSATEIGSSIFERGQRIKDELSAIKALAERRTNHPAGVLRITCPAILAEVLVVDFAVTFAKRYPDVLLTLNVSGGSFETRIEHYDLAIQPARETLANSELVRQRLVGAPYYLIAAPDLMRSLGKLPTLGGLNHCPGIGLAADGYASRWKLVSRAGKTAELNVALAINANNLNVFKQAALNGFGLARLPQIMCEAELRDGRLILPLPN